MKNKELLLDNTIVPYVVNEEGIEYYPIKYVMEQFLLKGTCQLHTKKEYKDYIGRYTIDYAFKGTTPQETYCMTKEGWILYSRNVKFRGFDNLQIKRHNLWCEHIGSSNIFEFNITNEPFDEYATMCINNFLKNNKECKQVTCNKCKRQLPLNKRFFAMDNRDKRGYKHICRMCNSVDYPILHPDSQATMAYRSFGLEGYKLYENNIYDFYKKYCHGNPNFQLKVDEDVLISILSKEYELGIINKQNVSLSYIRNNYNLTNLYKFSNFNIIEILSNNDCKYNPWLYPHYDAEISDINQACNIFGNYLKNNNIEIKNTLKYNDYEKLIDNAGLSKFIYGRNVRKLTSLEFIVKYYNEAYAGYKFKLRSVNYYKKKENCIFDMKWFIENDLKLDLTKIPLYVTKYSLNKKANPLYTCMRSNGYYKDLYTWINDCYPGMFVEADFTVNPFRSEFDSLEEAQVDEQLKLKLNNVIYNPRNSENTINIFGMIPDWIAITNKGCYLIEYFGMYIDNPGISTISFKYKNKTDKKIEKYISLEKYGYKHLFIFPNDLRNNFDGLNRKLNSILN